jgi:hypothetical protein
LPDPEHVLQTLITSFSFREFQNSGASSSIPKTSFPFEKPELELAEDSRIRSRLCYSEDLSTIQKKPAFEEIWTFKPLIFSLHQQYDEIPLSSHFE